MTDTFALLTIPQVADMLACTRQHVYTLIHEGRLETVNIAASSRTRTHMRVRVSALEDFLQRSTMQEGPTPEETTSGSGRTT